MDDLRFEYCACGRRAEFHHPDVWDSVCPHCIWDLLDTSDNIVWGARREPRANGETDTNKAAA